MQKTTMILRTFTFLTIVFLTTIGCQQDAKPEKFLIPNGRVGSVTIYYDQTNGQEIKYDGNRRVYLIPKSGSLSTQFCINDGWLDQEYYYIDSLGHEKQISIDSSVLYYNKPALADKFKAKHSTDTLIMQWGVAGKRGEKRFQEFVIGTYQTAYSTDTSLTDNDDK